MSEKHLPDLPRKLSGGGGAEPPAASAARDGFIDKFLAAPPDPTPGHLLTAPSELSTNFRHSGWAPFRKRVAEAFKELPEVSERRHAAFNICGADAYVEWQYATSLQNNKNYRIRCTKCHDRFCVPCSQEKGRIVRDVLSTHMIGRPNMSLITLTLKRSTDPLTTILDRITKHFRALRVTPLWKRAVRGGVAIIETKIGTDKDSWHCHFHVLAETKYIDQKELSATWLAITGDSEIVDIRRVGSHAGAIKYVTNYVTKSADTAVVTSPKHLREAITAFTRRRLISTFGSWRGLQLSERKEGDDNYYPPSEGWQPYRSLNDVLAGAAMGDIECKAILRELRRTPTRHAHDPPTDTPTM